MRFLLLLLALGLTACPPALDDDDSVGDDDDTADDDDAVDDDDDGVPTDCPADLADALESLGSWTVQHSCARAFFSVGTAGATERLALSFDLNNGPPIAQGASFALVYDDFEPKNGVPGSVTLQQGIRLFEYDCNDAIEQEPVVDLEFTAVAGSALLTVTEYNDEKWWSGSVELSGLVVEGPGGTCRIPDATWTDVGFGWLPG